MSCVACCCCSWSSELLCLMSHACSLAALVVVAAVSAVPCSLPWPAEAAPLCPSASSTSPEAWRMRVKWLALLDALAPAGWQWRCQAIRCVHQECMCWS